MARSPVKCSVCAVNALKKMALCLMTRESFFEKKINAAASNKVGAKTNPSQKRNTVGSIICSALNDFNFLFRLPFVVH